MSQIEMVTREIYVRHTDTDGNSYIAWHLVWDADRFMASQQETANKLNADAKPGKPRLAAVAQVSPEEYTRSRKQ